VIRGTEWCLPTRAHVFAYTLDEKTRAPNFWTLVFQSLYTAATIPLAHKNGTGYMSKSSFSPWIVILHYHFRTPTPPHRSYSHMYIHVFAHILTNLCIYYANVYTRRQLYMYNINSTDGSVEIIPPDVRTWPSF
jgi:hypothetical protein